MATVATISGGVVGTDVKKSVGDGTCEGCVFAEMSVFVGFSSLAGDMGEYNSSGGMLLGCVWRIGGGGEENTGEEKAVEGPCVVDKPCVAIEPCVAIDPCVVDIPCVIGDSCVEEIDSAEDEEEVEEVEEAVEGGTYIGSWGTC